MNTIKLTISEIKEIMSLVQSFYALENVRTILSENRDIINEFEFSEKDFSNLEKEINVANNNCTAWWKRIADKYGIEYDSKFYIDYKTCQLTLNIS